MPFSRPDSKNGIKKRLRVFALITANISFTGMPKNMVNEA